MLEWVFVIRLHINNGKLTAGNNKTYLKRNVQNFGLLWFKLVTSGFLTTAINQTELYNSVTRGKRFNFPTCPNISFLCWFQIKSAPTLPPTLPHLLQSINADTTNYKWLNKHYAQFCTPQVLMFRSFVSSLYEATQLIIVNWLNLDQFAVDAISKLPNHPSLFLLMIFQSNNWIVLC